MSDSNATELIEPLSATEARVLANQEDLIDAGLGTFVVVGQALMQIRDDRLYRQGYATFEDYCRERWGLARRSAYQYIEAAAVVNDVRNCAQILPANEAQARPLVSLEPEQRREVWAESVQTAPGGKMTAAHVEATKERMTMPPHTIQRIPAEALRPLINNDEIAEAQAALDTLEAGRLPLPPSTPDSVRRWMPPPTQSQVAASTLGAIRDSGRDDYIAQDFNRLIAYLLGATHIAGQVVREVPTNEVANVLTQDEIANGRRLLPTLQFVVGVYADYDRQKLRVVR